MEYLIIAGPQASGKTTTKKYLENKFRTYLNCVYPKLIKMFKQINLPKIKIQNE